MLEFLGHLDRLTARLDKMLPEETSPQSGETGPTASRFPEIDLEEFWRAHPGPQFEFVNSDCREILYGGAAGGGKSAALVALPLRFAHLERFRAVVLRRETTQLVDLLDKSEVLYPVACPGVKEWHSAPYKWRFPSGARVEYGHCQHEKNIAQYDGQEYQLICFDELTHFTKKQYLRITARLRSSDPRIPCYIRCTSNPGGTGHEWVFEHWGAWLDPDFEAPGLPPKGERPEGQPPALPGEVWWIRIIDGQEHYSREEPDDGGPVALTRTFIPARLEDNPSLCENDPAYAAQLDRLDAVRRAQLREGDWLKKPAAGVYFKREWCELVDPWDVPEGATIVRHWDRASRIPSPEYPDPDWTVGVKMARFNDTFWIVDLQRARLSPGGVDALMREVAEEDGPRVSIGAMQDPGQAGVEQVEHMSSNLIGYSVEFLRETGDITVRFAGFSSLAERHHVRIVRGAWNRALFEELEELPDGAHDDICAAVAGATYRLAGYIGAGMARTANEELARSMAATRWDSFEGARGFG